MPKVSTKDTPRTRVKNGAAVETVTTSIAKLQELLTQIEDLKQEGFPYRDAMQARVELHVRECVKLVFGDRSPESQQWKHYHVRATSPSEVADTIAQLHGLVARLDRKKCELLGITPPPEALTQDGKPAAGASGVTPASIPPTTAPHTAVPSTASAATPIVTAAGVTATAASAPETVETPAPHTSGTAPSPVRSPLPSKSHSKGHPSPDPDQASAPQLSPSPASPRTVPSPETPIAPEPRELGRDTAILVEAQAAAPRPLGPLSRIDGNQGGSPLAGEPPETVRSSSEPKPMVETDDPLDVIRKVCLRFHAVARQLRLRREYRPTLDVDDDRDVQDLLYALLRYELDEVGVQEWHPSYQPTCPSLAVVLPRHHLAVLAKKTRSGHGPREISHQLTLDAEEFSPAAGYRSLVCFVYDPEGRIGNPRGLEAELTKVSDAQVVEVVINPK